MRQNALRLPYFMLVVTLYGIPGVSIASEFLGIGENGNALTRSHAYGVSADGGVVVGTQQLDPLLNGFVWTPEGGTQELAGVRQAYGVSAEGRVIVGDGLNPSSGVVEPLRLSTGDGLQYLAGNADGTLDFPTTAVDASHNGDVVVGQTIFGHSFDGLMQKASINWLTSTEIVPQLRFLMTVVSWLAFGIEHCSRRLDFGGRRRRV